MSACTAGYNSDIGTQLKIFCDIINKNTLLKEVLTRAPLLGLSDYYVGAGCLAQTIWNYLSGYSLNRGINDIDLVFFDNSDLSYAREDNVIQAAAEIYQDIPIKIDIKNQARVHLWYAEHFGYAINPYASLEEAINTWPTTATAIGCKLDANNSWTVYAPCGLNDVLGRIVRANKTQITKDIYEKKVARWCCLWPDLTIIPWEK